MSTKSNPTNHQQTPQAGRQVLLTLPLSLNTRPLRVVTSVLIVVTLAVLLMNACQPLQEPIVGTWHIKNPSAGIEAFWTFHADGTLTETTNFLGELSEGPGHGVWQRTAAGYSLTFFLFQFDEVGKHSGMATVSCLVQLVDADHLTGAGSLVVKDLAGKVIISGADDPDTPAVFGDRLKVEPPAVAQPADPAS